MPTVSLFLGLCAEATLLMVAIVLINRLLHESVLLAVSAASFGTRLLLGQCFYLISAHHVPILQQYQLPNGFWSFGYDAKIFDSQARLIASMGGYSHLGTVRQAVFATSDDIARFVGTTADGSVTWFSRATAILYAIFGFHESVV